MKGHSRAVSGETGRDDQLASVFRHPLVLFDRKPSTAGASIAVINKASGFDAVRYTNRPRYPGHHCVGYPHIFPTR